MTEQAENLVSEMLCKMQGDLSAVREDMHSVKLGMTALEHHFATMVAYQAEQSDCIDGIERRLERVERGWEFPEGAL